MKKDHQRPDKRCRPHGLGQRRQSVPDERKESDGSKHTDAPFVEHFGQRWVGKRIGAEKVDAQAQKSREVKQCRDQEYRGQDQGSRSNGSFAHQKGDEKGQQKKGRGEAKAHGQAKYCATLRPFLLLEQAISPEPEGELEGIVHNGCAAQENSRNETKGQ